MVEPPQPPVALGPAFFTALSGLILLLDIWLSSDVAPMVVAALFIAVPTWFLGVKRYLGVRRAPSPATFGQLGRGCG